jgi:16S rRNA (uracil1498-N3)-methyltransferase
MPLPADAAPSHLFLDELPASGERRSLAGDEAHYLARVCRARPGDVAHATDGRGGLARLRVVELRPLVVVEGEALDRIEARRTAWLFCGPPEGERGDWLVEKLAELGIAVLVPVNCERGGWADRGPRVERWRRLAIAALRQSRRRFLLEIRSPIPLAEVGPSLPEGALRFLADPDGRQVAGWAPPSAGASIGLVGPSEGLSRAERDLSSRLGFDPIRLSGARLRAETAAVAWAAWWSGGEAAIGVESI